MPSICFTNLINIYSSLSGSSVKEVEKNYHARSVSDFKTDLAELVITVLSPISKEYNRLITEKDYINVILSEGHEKAAARAQETLLHVKKKIGLKRE